MRSVSRASQQAQPPIARTRGNWLEVSSNSVGSARVECEARDDDRPKRPFAHQVHSKLLVLRNFPVGRCFAYQGDPRLKIPEFQSQIRVWQRSRPQESRTRTSCKTFDADAKSPRRTTWRVPSVVNSSLFDDEIHVACGDITDAFQGSTSNSALGSV